MGRRPTAYPQSTNLSADGNTEENHRPPRPAGADTMCPVYLATGVAGASSSANLADFADSDWVVPPSRWTCREMIQRACGAAGIAPIVTEVSDFAAILALVGVGAGVASVPELTVMSFLALSPCDP